MRDDEDRPLGALQEGSEARDVANNALGPVLAAGHLVLRPVRTRPGPVVREQTALELAEADVVQLREDEPWDLPSGERQVGGLLGALELADGAEVDLGRGEMLAEEARLRPSCLGQGDLDLRAEC